MALLDYILRVRDQGGGVDKAAADMGRLRRETEQAGRAARTASGGFAEFGKAAGLGASVAIFQQLGGVVTNLARQVPRMALDLIAYGDRLGKFSDRVGVSAELLQQFRFAAQQTGVEANTADLALQRFSRRFGEAAQGTGELLPVLEQYGIAIRNQDGSTRALADVLGDFAEVIQSIQDPTERLRVAFKGFDSEGAALVNTLSGGKEGLKGFFDELERLGGIVSDENVERLEKVTDAMGRLKAQATAGGANIVANVAKRLGIGNTEEDELLHRYIVDNAPAILANVEDQTGGRPSLGARLTAGFHRTMGMGSRQSERMARDALTQDSDLLPLIEAEARRMIAQHAEEIRTGRVIQVGAPHEAVQAALARPVAPAAASSPAAVAADPVGGLAAAVSDLTTLLRDQIGVGGLGATPGDTLSARRAADRGLIRSAENAAAALQDGVQEGELEGLKMALEKLAEAAVTRNANQQQQINLILSRLEQLADQIAAQRN